MPENQNFLLTTENTYRAAIERILLARYLYRLVGSYRAHYFGMLHRKRYTRARSTAVLTLSEKGFCSFGEYTSDDQGVACFDANSAPDVCGLGAVLLFAVASSRGRCLVYTRGFGFCMGVLRFQSIELEVS